MKKFFFLVLFLAQPGSLPASELLAVDWSVKKTGNVALTFFVHKKEKVETVEFRDIRGGQSGILFDYSKVYIKGHPSPYLLTIFGHGAKNFSFKVINPLKEKDERVVFEQESISDMPSYDLKGKAPKYDVVKITFYQQEENANKLYEDMSNTTPNVAYWPTDRAIQSVQKKKSQPPAP